MKDTRKSNAIDLGEFTEPITETISLKVLESIGGRTLVGDEKHRGLIDVWHALCGGSDNHAEIARRMVACWNFCEGISTDGLETQIERLKTIRLRSAGSFFIGTQTGIEDLDGPLEIDPFDLAHDYEAMQYGSDAPTEYDPS